MSSSPPGRRRRRPSRSRRWSARSALSWPRRQDPFSRARLRIGVQRDVGDDRDDVRAGLQAQFRPLGVEAADGDKRNGAEAALPVPDPFEPLRGEGHRFQDRRVDRPERDIVGLKLERALEFGVVVRADAEPEARAADGGNVRAVEIALAEVNPGGALIDGDSPEIVDDEVRARIGADGESLTRLACDCGLVPILHPELDELRADANEPSDPGGAVDDRVERIETAHKRFAFPTTGVEGAAMSRGCIGPARKAARPASIPCAKARAIATGSPALATAVLSKTPS